MHQGGGGETPEGRNGLEFGDDVFLPELFPGRQVEGEEAALGAEAEEFPFPYDGRGDGPLCDP